LGIRAREQADRTQLIPQEDQGELTLSMEDREFLRRWDPA